MTDYHKIDCCPDFKPEKPSWLAPEISEKEYCIGNGVPWKGYPEFIAPVANSIGYLTGLTLPGDKGPAWSVLLGPLDGTQGVAFNLPAILDSLVDGYKTQGYPTQIDGIPVFLCFDGRSEWDYVVDTSAPGYDPHDPDEWTYKLVPVGPASGNDSVAGGTNADELFGGGGNDTLNGNMGDDWIEGNDGDDVLLGGAGKDYIQGGNGNDNINGGSGRDSISGGEGNDTIDGGTGDDCIDGDGGDDVIRDFFGASKVNGGDGNDDIRTGNKNDTIDGGEGNDTIRSNDGDDQICGGGGNDDIIAGNGNDLVDAGSGNDRVQGDAGNDSLEGGEGDDTMMGGEGDDVLVDGSGNDRLFGNDGDDVIYMGAGNDRATGGTGCDTFVFTDCDVPVGKNMLGKQDKITDFNILEGDKLDLTCVENLDWMTVIRFDANTLILNGYADSNRDDKYTADDFQIFQLVLCGTAVGDMGINDTFYSSAAGSGPIIMGEWTGVDLPTNDDFEYPGLLG